MSERDSTSLLHPDLERRIARAEAAVAVLKPKFRTALERDLVRIGEIAADPFGTDSLDDLKALVHDVKGTAGGFGFSLVSDVAASLYAYLDVLDAPDPTAADIVRDHANSMIIAATEPLDAEARAQIDEFIALSQRITADLRDDS